MATLLEVSRELAAIAQAGLTYSRDPYDRERFTRLRQMAGELLQIPGYSPDFKWPDEIGYPTPKVDVRAVVFRGREVLLIQEVVSGKWTLPGGWADVNASPAENVERECREETGYEVKARELVTIVDRDRAGYPRNALTIYKLFFLCDLVGGAPTTSMESSHVEFFPVDHLPELDPDRTSKEDLLRAFEHHQRPGQPAHFN